MAMRKLLFTLIFLSTLTLSPVQAQEGQTPPARDVRVVVDISGSMKVNDPDNLRRPAVRLIARLLPEGTQVGLWTFGRMVNMLVPHDALDDELRNTLVSDSDKINSVAQRTNIGGAIEEAADNWYAPDRSLTNTHLILLSDGKVDISPNQASNDRERNRILEELVPALAEQGLTIHTIALSGEADLDLLGAIADMTGGVARVADSADELSRLFADTMGQAVPANEVPLEDKGFTVDGGVEEFTALIFSATPAGQRELALVNPEGERYGPDVEEETVRWAREAGYDLITVTRPEAGDWQMEGTPGEGSRVTVVSDLRLEVEPIPARFRLGEEVDLRAFFTEEGERITDPDFLGVITVTLSMTTEDGRQGSRVLNEGQPPADGIYQDTIARLPEPGQYLLELEADGSTFSRKFRKTLVLEAPEGAGPVPADGDSVPLAPETGDDADQAGTDSAYQPESDGPIDLSQLEEPAPEPPAEPEPTPQPEEPSETDASPQASDAEPSLTDRLLAWWPWAAGGLGALVLAGGILLLLKRRRGAGDEDALAGAADDAPEDVGPDATDDSDMTSSEQAAAVDDNLSGEVEEDAVDPDQEEAPGDALVDDSTEDSAASDSRDGQEEVPEPAAVDDGDAGEPEAPKEGEGSPRPEPEAEQTEPATEPQGEEPPTATVPEDADSPEDEPAEDDDEEFGLEDFDLSDIDDLPDLETDEDENEREKPSEEDKKPKE
ncbi:VWA domain-containing protein [Marinobacter sp. LN3S78]|uniref:VWA domain-containing protein n=1 Tax=Marinobacter sp. LN3S78 TaxID=3382300 RepID=UPI00387ABF38